MLGFLEKDILPSLPEKAFFHFISVPLEKSVSYGKGTKYGPQAILKASQELETFDGFSNPGELGLYTHKSLDCKGNINKILSTIEAKVTEVLQRHQFPIVLGGEHTVTVGVCQALTKLKEPVGIIQFDAHADLKDSYENNPYSHACAMRRAYDLGIEIFQIGIRSLTREEETFRKEKGIKSIDAYQFFLPGFNNIAIPHHFPQKVFITIDIDIFDASIMPATGTPEPGGLTWYQMLHVLNHLAQEKKIIGFDIVELAPLKGLMAYDFTVARLIYNLMGMIQRTII